MTTFNYGFESLSGWTMWIAPNPPKDLVTPDMNIEDTRTGASPLAVHTGPTALRFVKHWSTWHAGVYRQFAVNPLSLIKLSAWGRIWNVNVGVFPAPSDTNTHPWLRVGIDKTGGINPASQSVTWNEIKVYDQWMQVAVQDVALASVATIFVGFENGRTGQWDLRDMMGFLDDVSVEISNPTPPPSTSAALGIVRVEEGATYFDITTRWPKII